MTPNTFYLRIAVVLAISVVLPGVWQGRRVEYIGWGTIAAHTMLAAAWCALGPLRLEWRLPISVLWPMLVYLAIDQFTHGSDLVGPYDLPAFLLVLWIGTFLLTWLTQHATGWRLRSVDFSPPANERQWQFSLRELFILMGITACLFGLLRLWVPNFLRTTWSSITWQYWAFWLLAQWSLGLPLLFTALGQRQRWKLVAGGLVLSVIGANVVWRYLDHWLSPEPDLGFTIAISLLVTTILGAIVRQNVNLVATTTSPPSPAG